MFFLAPKWSPESLPWPSSCLSPPLFSLFLKLQPHRTSSCGSSQAQSLPSRRLFPPSLPSLTPSRCPDDACSLFRFLRQTVPSPPDKILLKWRFWFCSSGVEPKILHFYQVPGWIRCCQSKDHILSKRLWTSWSPLLYYPMFLYSATCVLCSKTCMITKIHWNFAHHNEALKINVLQ